jgi:hypothetical protein
MTNNVLTASLAPPKLANRPLSFHLSLLLIVELTDSTAVPLSFTERRIYNNPKQ